MSDIFDHELDAMESRDEAYAIPSGRLSGGSTFVANPLFYHVEVNYDCLLAETSEAWLIDSRWVPKSICRDHEPENNTIWIHEKTYDSILDTEPVVVRDEEPF